MMRLSYLWVVALLGLGGLGGCDSGGSPTGSTCDTASVLTWETYGQPFMKGYGTDCHSEYGNVDRLRRGAAGIDLYAGSGQKATNTVMPKSGSKPSLEERQQLSAWLACGAP